MNKVITIDLNKRAYQLEEEGYEALRFYLDRASAQLGINPDKDEIMSDFEQAIADKCDRLLNLHKTVVMAQEIEQIIKEMGPVEGAQPDEKISSSKQHTRQDASAKESKKTNEQNSQSSSSSSETTPKKLFQIREGAMISGVCTGLAAYFNIDVTLVRLIFVGLTILTQGAWILVYVIMAIVVPYANTSEEKATARGQVFNAQELLQRAREKYAHMDKNYWKSQKKYWKNWFEEQKQQWNNGSYEGQSKFSSKAQPSAKVQSQSPLRAHSSKFETGLSTGLGVMIAIIMSFFSLLWVMAIVSIISTGTLLGFAFGGIPLWLSIILITCAYNIVLLPLRSFRAASLQQGAHGQDIGFFGILDTIMWFTFIGFLCWLSWVYLPQSHFLWNKIFSWWEHLTHIFIKPS